MEYDIIHQLSVITNHHSPETLESRLQLIVHVYY